MKKQYIEFVKKLGIKIEKKEDNEIYRKTYELIDEMIKKIESLIYPDTTIDMYEAENLSRQVKQELVKSFRILNKIKNIYNIAKLSNNDKEYERFLKELKENWEKIKDSCIKAFKEAEKAWGKEFKQEKETYFG